MRHVFVQLSVVVTSLWGAVSRSGAESSALQVKAKAKAKAKAAAAAPDDDDETDGTALPLVPLLTAAPQDAYNASTYKAVKDDCTTIMAHTLFEDVMHCPPLGIDNGGREVFICSPNHNWGF
jgi:hypothetical protein